MKHLLILITLLTTTVPPGLAATTELVALEGARLIEAGGNDGDSFLVQAGGERLRLRLYFVDCMETRPGSAVEVKRIREQQRHFGLADARAVVRFGDEAAAFTRGVLGGGFTVYTNYSSALGRSAGGRVYGFVKTRQGKYLSEELVRAGLARIHGKTRENPDGVSSDVTLQKLRDLQMFALLKRAGIWRESDPNLLLQLREEQRRIKRETKDDLAYLSGVHATDGDPINLNSASSEELQSIPGVGKVTAEAIITNRPYHKVEDLLRVSGIGPGKLSKIAPHVTANTGASTAY